MARTNTNTGGGGGTIMGSGTTNFIPKFTPNGTTIGNSQLFDNGTNIGFGTLVPAAKFHIQSNLVGSLALRIENLNSGITSSASFQAKNDLGNQTQIGITSSTFTGTSDTALWTTAATGGIRLSSTVGDIVFATSGVNVMTIDSATNHVGIGTASPTTLFHINSASSGAFRLVDTTQAAGFVLTSNATGVGTWQAPAAAPSLPFTRIAIGSVTNTISSDPGFTIDLVNNNVFLGALGNFYPPTTNLNTINIGQGAGGNPGIVGNENINIGTFAGGGFAPIPSGNNHIFLGQFAGSGATGDNVIALGQYAGQLNVASNKIYFGGDVGTGAEIPNWAINGQDYVMPPNGGYVAGGALTDVAGNGILTWTVPAGTFPGGGQGAVQFNNGPGTFAGNENQFFFDPVVNALAIGSNQTSLIVDGVARQAKFLVQADGPVYSDIVNIRYINGADNVGGVLGTGSANGTIAAPTASLVGDNLGAMFFDGYDGASFWTSSAISSYAEGVIAPGIVPSSMYFQTTDALGVLTNRMQINSAGSVGVGIAAGVLNSFLAVRAPQADVTLPGKGNIIVAAQGGDDDGAAGGGAGGNEFFRGGQGGTAIGFAAGDGGTLTLEGGRGGDGDAIVPSGNGADLVLVGGSSGVNNGGGTGIAGKIYFLGGQKITVFNITANYQVVESDYMLACDSIAAPFTVTLPAVPQIGDQYVIKDATGNAGANNITVDGGAINIDGALTYVLSVNYASITVVYTGPTWSII